MSTTKAELLALSQAAKEGLFIGRLLKELRVTLDTPRLTFEVNNTQTIYLVTEEIAYLKTNLRHMDIYNHQLRQEYVARKIDIQYTESAKMIADSLTKALVQDQFIKFREQLGIVDVGVQLAERSQEADSQNDSS